MRYRCPFDRLCGPTSKLSNGETTMTSSMSLDNFLSLPPEEFVAAAYELLLDRQADEGGKDYYIARLRNGYSKLSVASQLSRSDEARRGAGIPGLGTALSRYRMGRLPIVGWIFRKLWRVEGETVHERLQRSILVELSALRAQLRAGVPAAGSNQSQSSSSASRAHASGRTTSTSGGQRNRVAEQLSPRAREIFERLTSS